jgi:hypothetical protein
MSDKAQQLFDEAMQANLVGDTSRSTDLLKQVVDEDPENLAAWEALARQLTDTNERRMALTTVLQLDPDNEYAKNALESVEKPKGIPDDHAELAPGIPMKQARTVGIGLVLYTVLVCGATLLITSAINGNKAARAQEVANSQAFQTQTQDAILAAATSAVLTATQASLDANATLLAQVTATPTVTATRAFELPTEIPPTPTPTTVSLRVADAPPSLPGRVLAWGGEDVRSKDYLPLHAYSLSAQGLSEPFLIEGQRELGRNPFITLDNNTTILEQWRADAPRLFVSSLSAITPGSSLDTLVSNQFLIVNLRDPSATSDAKRVAFIATDYNTKKDDAYVADLTDPAFTKVYKLSQDAASYTGITLSPDGTKAVAVRVDGGNTDLVVFDLTNLAAAPVPAALPTAAEGTPTSPPPPTVPPPAIPLRPLTTDGNALIEGAPSFSPDGTRVVYEAASSSAPDNRDLYIITVGTAPGTPQPIMTTDGNDILPTFSPDGNMVAFASDRQTGIYNIFIYDTQSRATYQLSEEPLSVYPGSWVN